jgi:V-type H+-transporting ATPase subunit d
MELVTFNIDNGYSEALVRGMRAGFLRKEDYDTLNDCKKLEEVKMVLEDTDYLAYIQTEPSPVAPSRIKQRMREKLAKEFEHLKGIAAPELHEFLERLSHKYMIDNVVTLIEGTRNQEPEERLLAGTNPLGHFTGMKDIINFHGEDFAELYHIVLIDTPVGEYFQRFIEEFIDTSSLEGRTLEDVHRQFREVTPELLRITLQKIWLEELHSFCQNVNPTSRELLNDLLCFEADCMTIQIIYNSLNVPDLVSPAARESDRKQLCPNFGYLYLYAEQALAKAHDLTTLRAAVACFEVYRELLDRVPDPVRSDELADPTRVSLDTKMYAVKCRKYSACFDNQFHYGSFYAYLRLKEQEIRNVAFLAEMVPLVRERESMKKLSEQMIPFHCLLTPVS